MQNAAEAGSVMSEETPSLDTEYSLVAGDKGSDREQG